MKSVCNIKKIDDMWCCSTPDGVSKHYTRSQARSAAYDYNKEREALIKEEERQQAYANFYEGNRSL